MWDYVAADRPGVTVTHSGDARRQAVGAPRGAARDGGDGRRAVPAGAPGQGRGRLPHRRVHRRAGGVRPAVRRSWPLRRRGRRGRLRGAAAAPHPVPAGAARVPRRGERSSMRCTTTAHASSACCRLLDEQMLDNLAPAGRLEAIYVEFPDNLHGGMTNPRLFARYCLPDYQRYIGVLHGQGRKVGSHTDGDVGPLLALLKESGLDVCESFSPFPLTACTFDEAWAFVAGRTDHLGRHPVTAPGRRPHGRGQLPGVRGASAGHGRRGADHPGGGRSGDGQQLDRTSQIHRRAGRGA